MSVVIHNIAIQVPTGDNYVTPDMQKALDFYVQYERHCIRTGQTPYGRRAYLLAVCSGLAKTGIERDGKMRTKDEILKRVLEHFGLPHLKAWFDEGMSEAALPQIPIEVLAEAENDVQVYGESYLHVTVKTWRRIHPDRVALKTDRREDEKGTAPEIR
jgi:hypothetical protein